MADTTVATETPRSRQQWADIAKGIGISLVVMGHDLRGLVSSGIMEWTPVPRFVDAWIYSFHMPLFFVLSGLFLSWPAARSWPMLFWDKIRSIAYPYFIWSTITLMIKIPLGNSVNQPRFLSDFSRIFYDPIEQFWFLYVLFFLSLLVGALLRFRFGTWIALLIVGLVYPGVLSIPDVTWPPSFEIRLYGIYLALGCAFGLRSISQALDRTRTRDLGALVAICFLIISLFVSLSAGLCPPIAIIGTIGVIALSFLLQDAVISGPLSLLGRYSLEIFVAHTIAAAAVRIFLQDLAHITNIPAHLVLGTLAGLLFPILLAKGLGRIGLNYAFRIPPTRHRYLMHKEHT
jgi:fucose 4-O-acetylase-like acetyltransferase